MRASAAGIGCGLSRRHGKGESETVPRHSRDTRSPRQLGSRQQFLVYAAFRVVRPSWSWSWSLTATESAGEGRHEEVGEEEVEADTMNQVLLREELDPGNPVLAPCVATHGVKRRRAR